MAQRDLLVRRRLLLKRIKPYNRFNDADRLRDADEAIARYLDNVACLKRCVRSSLTKSRHQQPHSITDGQPAQALDDDVLPLETARARVAALWREAAGDAPLPAALEGPGDDAAAAHTAVAALRAQLQDPPPLATPPRLTGLLSLHDAGKLDALARGRPVQPRMTALAQGPRDAGSGAVTESEWASVCAALPTSTVYTLD